MRVAVSDNDVNRYSGLAQTQAAHRERREKFFPAPKPTAATLAPVESDARVSVMAVPSVSLDVGPLGASPLAALAEPREPTPIEKTILEIVSAVATKLNLT